MEIADLPIKFVMFHYNVSLPEGKMIHISIFMVNPSMDICYDICSLFVNQTSFYPSFRAQVSRAQPGSIMAHMIHNYLVFNPSYEVAYTPLYIYTSHLINGNFRILK